METSIQNVPVCENTFQVGGHTELLGTILYFDFTEQNAKTFSAHNLVDNWNIFYKVIREGAAKKMNNKINLLTNNKIKNCIPIKI